LRRLWQVGNGLVISREAFEMWWMLCRGILQQSLANSGMEEAQTPLYVTTTADLEHSAASNPSLRCLW
jgi:hypothetical protein